MNHAHRNASQNFRALVGFVLAGLTVGMLFAQGVNASEASERGTKNYMQFCQGCHGADKAGLVNFTGELEDLQAILDGETNQMPDFYGVFSEDEIADIYAFLRMSD